MNVVKDEVIKELNWKERIVVKVFSKTFEKVYKLGITFGFNNKWIAWKLHEKILKYLKSIVMSTGW